MSSFPKDKHTTKCIEEGRCLESLQLILDGEASQKEEEEFMDHLDICMPCYNHYKLDRAVKELLQTKVVRLKMPEQLVKKLKLQLANINESK